MSLQGTIVHKEKFSQRKSPPEQPQKRITTKRLQLKTNKSNIDPPQVTIARHQPKNKSFRFEDQNDHINPMENTHKDTHIIDTQEQSIEDAEFEQEKFFE